MKRFKIKQGMTWEDACEYLAAGYIVRRPTWRPWVLGIWKHPTSRFVTLLGFCPKPWSPYFEDFSAKDWCVVGFLEAQS